MIEAARRLVDEHGRGHDPVPRRGAPVQQEPAGRPPAGGRGRHPHPDRGDHGEPVLRGQRPAAQPLDMFRLEPLDPRRCDGGPSARLDREGATADDDAIDLLVNLVDGDARAALTSLEVALALAPDRPGHPGRRRGGPQRPGPPLRGGRPLRHRSRAFIKSIRGSRSRRRRCTGWPACWPRGRTPGSSPAAWSSWPARTSGMADPMAWSSPTPRPGRSSSSACPRPSSIWPRRRPPGHRAEVEPGHRRARPGASRRAGPADRTGARPTCATPTTAGRPASATGRLPVSPRRPARLGRAVPPRPPGGPRYYEPSEHGAEADVADGLA